MTTLAPPNPLEHAAELIDPTQWESGEHELKDHQRPDRDDFAFWLMEGGRGSGKTEGCAHYYTKFMRAKPKARGRIIAPTYDDAVESCIKGPSGLEAIDPEVKMIVRPGGTKVVWPNGSEALVLGTHSPRDVDRLRAGGNRDIDWWEEIAANPQLGGVQKEQGAWAQAQLGLRLGINPQTIASTTPRNTKAYREVRALADLRSHATLLDNKENLAPVFVERMLKTYEGTRLGRQELLGELLTDVEGSLWTLDLIDAGRVEWDDVPDLVRVVVALDPAATDSSTADDTGMIVAAKGADGHVYITADRTCHLSPEQWGVRAVRAYEEFDGDAIVGEKNNGGDMVEGTIRAVEGGEDLKYIGVHASRGKQTRAEPVAALYGDGKKRKPRIHHVGSMPELEDQMSTWVPGEGKSPDRVDALVWAVTELALGKQGSWAPL